MTISLPCVSSLRSGSVMAAQLPLVGRALQPAPRRQKPRRRVRGFCLMSAGTACSGGDARGPVYKRNRVGGFWFPRPRQLFVPTISKGADRSRRLALRRLLHPAAGPRAHATMAAKNPPRILPSSRTTGMEPPQSSPIAGGRDGHSSAEAPIFRFVRYRPCRV